MHTPKVGSRNTASIQATTKRPLFRPIVTSLAGIGVALYMLLSAGLDPWQWWIEQVRSASEHRVDLHGSTDAPQLANAVQPEPIGTDSSVAPSPARLVLTRTRLGRNANEGYAELGVNAASPQTYRAGAILANGARIEEIHADHVVLARDGQRQRIYMDGTAPAGHQLSDNALALVGGVKAQAAAIANSADELTNHIRVAPVYAGPVVRALKVYPTQHSTVFAGLGLEPGDHITAIDGRAVTDFAQAIASLRQLSGGVAVLVTIERNGRSTALSLDGLILTAARKVAMN